MKISYTLPNECEATVTDVKKCSIVNDKLIIHGGFDIPLSQLKSIESEKKRLQFNLKSDEDTPPIANESYPFDSAELSYENHLFVTLFNDKPDDAGDFWIDEISGIEEVPE